MPIAIHILAKRRAERVPFPTLRFIQPGRLAAVRRHVLEDFPLLAVRLLILAAAVVALAGPLVVTRQREAMWNAQVRTAVVDDGDLPGGMRRAMADLVNGSSGRLEILVRSTFPIGSIRQADIDAVAPIGVRFERTAALPPTRTVDAPPVLTEGGVRARAMTVARHETTIREMGLLDRLRPIEVSSSPSDAPAVDAALVAVLAQRVLAPKDGRRIRVVFTGAPDYASAVSAAAPVRDAWIADALAAMARDDELRDAAALVAASSDQRLAAPPFVVVARALDGSPLAAGASAAGALLIVTAAPPASLSAPVLMRSALNAIGDRHTPLEAETESISDAQLNAWTRPPASLGFRLEAMDHDDRRWLWIAALALLAREWLLRSRKEREPSGEREEREPLGEREAPRV